MGGSDFPSEPPTKGTGGGDKGEKREVGEAIDGGSCQPTRNAGNERKGERERYEQ